MYLAPRLFSFVVPFLVLALLAGQSSASLGDHLPDFKECVQVMPAIFLDPEARLNNPLGL